MRNIRQILFLLTILLSVCAAAAMADTITKPISGEVDCDQNCIVGVDYCCLPNPKAPNDVVRGCRAMCPDGFYCTQLGNKAPYCTNHNGHCNIGCQWNRLINNFQTNNDYSPVCDLCVDSTFQTQIAPGSTEMGRCKTCECDVRTPFDSCPWAAHPSRPQKTVKKGCLFNKCPSSGKDIVGDSEPADKQFFCTIHSYNKDSNQWETKVNPRGECVDTVCGCWGACRNPLPTHTWEAKKCQCDSGSVVCGAVDMCTQEISCCPSGNQCIDNGDGSWGCTPDSPAALENPRAFIRTE